MKQEQLLLFYAVMLTLGLIMVAYFIYLFNGNL